MSTAQKIGLIVFTLLTIGIGTIVAYELKNTGIENGSLNKLEDNTIYSPEENISDAKSDATLASTSDKRFALLEAKINKLQSRLDLIEGKTNPSPLLNEDQIEQPSFAASFRRGPGSVTSNLIAVGIDPNLAEEIQRKRSELELARLVLRDKATRGGYLGEDQYQEELNALNESEPSLREEIGDRYYDRFLYTSGQANRISIGSVMSGSAADGAGIRDGDLLVSYAGQRLFRWQELRGITTSGVSGEIVDVRVIRDGNEISLNMPRGPLGVRLNQKRVDPDPS